MKRIKIMVVCAIFGASLLGSTAPAPAMTCADFLREPCAVAGTVICRVVAKGQPCLM